MRPPDALLDALPPLPRDGSGPVFREPWEAQAFAMTLALHQAGHFTWPDWVAVFSAQLARHDDHGLGYYGDWVAALETITTQRGLTTQAHLSTRSAAWLRAALATPHGQPILLENDPG